MDDLITQGVLLLFGSALLGGLLGFGFTWWRHRRLGGDQFVSGVALGLLVFASCTCFGALRVGWAAWQQQRGMSPAEGQLIDYISETHVDSKTRRSTTLLAPRVAFTAADGRSYQVKGLGGSQPNKMAGDAVPVLYSTANPATALVADFQNQWGPFWALSGFGGFGLLAGLFFTMEARREARERRETSRRRSGRAAVEEAPSKLRQALQAWRDTHGERFSRSFTAAAGLCFVAALLYPAFGPSDNLGRVISISFAGVATAMACFAIATFCSRHAQGTALGVLGILTCGFGFFAFGLWMLTAT